MFSAGTPKKAEPSPGCNRDGNVELRHRLETYAALLSGVWSDVSEAHCREPTNPRQPRDQLICILLATD